MRGLLVRGPLGHSIHPPPPAGEGEDPGTGPKKETIGCHSSERDGENYSQEENEPIPNCSSGL